MKYFSTRNKKTSLGFADIFQRGLAPDGGLFIPHKIKKFNKSQLTKLRKLNYNDLALEIIADFCKPDIERKKLKTLIKNSYKPFKKKNAVSLIDVGNFKLLELYHGPTLAFKDIAMQAIGHMYEEFNKSKDGVTNIVVATSGDTGAAAISALSNRKNINLFVLHPHNKISKIQRKIMTTIGGKNIYNLAVKGSFDDCQKIVKEMFADNLFRQTINMSGVNSINWARIIFQIVYYFFAYFKIRSKKINFSVPTGNFGDIYAGYIAKQMGLPIEKLIIATNENDILRRVVNTGLYKPTKVKPSLSPSMDIQVSSNFERLLFNILNSDKRVKQTMHSLKDKGYFKLDNKSKNKIKKDFAAFKTSNQDTKKIINAIFSKYKIFLDPHTATGFNAARQLKSNYPTVILGTAHPYKFIETMRNATGKIIKRPSNLSKSSSLKEKYDIIANNTNLIKKYILDKQYEN